MVSSFGRTMGVKAQMICTTPYVLTQSVYHGNVGALPRIFWVGIFVGYTVAMTAFKEV